MSFQPEERYWTDYLRIALPVMGLLLLIGLLWFWAQELIGSPGNEPPPPQTELAAISTINATPPPPAPTSTSVPVEPTPGPPPAPTATVAAVTAAEPTPLPQPTAAATTAPAAAAADAEDPCGDAPPSYPPGAAVETTETVNLREGPSTDDAIVTELPAGTELTIAGEFAEAGQCDWWPVSVSSTNQAGFVREDFLTEAGA